MNGTRTAASTVQTSGLANECPVSTVRFMSFEALTEANCIFVAHSLHEYLRGHILVRTILHQYLRACKTNCTLRLITSSCQRSCIRKDFIEFTKASHVYTYGNVHARDAQAPRVAHHSLAVIKS